MKMKMQATRTILILFTLLASIELLAQSEQPEQLGCEEVIDVKNGFLCVIKPSLTDETISDTSFTGDGKHKFLGFGYHVIGVPNSLNHKSPIHVHFGGSYGRPYLPVMGRIPSKRLLSEGVESGRLIIQLAYDNKYSVNLDRCQQEKSLDNCAGQVRLEKQTGQDVSGLATTSKSNSIDFRFQKLIEYLKTKGIIEKARKVTWNDVDVSGHSQGGGQALFIAMNYGVKRACLYAGGYDIGDTVNNADNIPMADWIKMKSKTPMERITAIVHTAEKHYHVFSAAFKHLGLYELNNVFEVSHEGENFSNPHGAVVSAPELTAIRKQACY